MIVEKVGSITVNPAAQKWAVSTVDIDDFADTDLLGVHRATSFGVTNLSAMGAIEWLPAKEVKALTGLQGLDLPSNTSNSTARIGDMFGEANDGWVGQTTVGLLCVTYHTRPSGTTQNPRVDFYRMRQETHQEILVQMSQAYSYAVDQGLLERPLPGLPVYLRIEDDGT